jgi:hypothetical protein
LVDDPSHPAGFKGTFKFSDHKLIPDVYQGFLQRHFGVLRLSRIKIEEINKLMNEVWEGPGSLEKLFRMEEEYRESGRVMHMTPADYVKVKKAVDDDEEKDSEDDLPLPTFGGDDEDDI